MCGVVASPRCPSPPPRLHGLDLATIQGHWQPVSPYMCQCDIQEQSSYTHHLPPQPRAAHLGLHTVHAQCFPGPACSSISNVAHSQKKKLLTNNWPLLIAS